jgi:hypothetical protein
VTAIVPLRLPDETRLVRFASGGVAADVRLNEDGRGRSTSYALHLAAAEEAVSGRLVGVLASGDVVELGSLEVAPGSVGGSRFAVALGGGTRFTGVFLEIRSGLMTLRVAAPQLLAPRKPRALYAGVAVAVVSVVAVAAGAALTPFLPGMPLLATPGHAVAGELVTLPYETRGLGAASFSATLDDRTPLAAGGLAAARGEIAVAIPQSAAHKRVSVVLEQRSPFGRMERIASFPVAAPPPPAHTVASAARVVVFSARRERGSAGESVLASYLAVGDGGTLAVTNAHGRIVASAPFSHRGTQRLTLPGTVALEPVLVRLTVGLGSQHATAAVDLPPALPMAAVPVAPPKTDAAGADQLPTDQLPESVAAADDQAATAPGGSETVAVIGQPIAGRPFIVQIRAPASAMRLRLEDDAGSVIEDVAVPDGARRVTLTAPAGGGRTYYLTCTYGRGNAQEVVVRSIRVRAP